MVKRSYCKIFHLVLITPWLIALVFIFQACALRDHWGEKSSQPLVVNLSPSKEASCGEFTQIISGTEDESQQTLGCWINEVNKLWTEIRGENLESFTLSELEVLMQNGIIQISENPADFIKKLRALFELTGIGSTITHSKYDEWVDWLHAHRKEFRSISYQWKTGEQSFQYSLVKRSLAALSAFLSEASWQMTSEDLATHLQNFFAFSDGDVQKALLPAIRAAWNTFAMTCPKKGAPLNDFHWNSNELAQCLTSLPKQFEVGQTWLEFYLNPVQTVPDSKQILEIKNSLSGLEAAVKNRFNQPGLKNLKTRLFLELAESMGAKPPEDFIDSLRIIRKFDPKSTEESLHPSLIINLFEILKNSQIKILDGLPYFVKSFIDHHCSNSQAQDWRSCVPPLDQKIAKKFPSIALALAIKKPTQGMGASPFDGLRFVKISTFDAIAEKVITAFDTNHDGLIQTEGQNDADEVVQLITLGLESIDTFYRFLRNIERKLNQLPVETTHPWISLSHYDLHGLARLLTLFGTDLLVQRDIKEKSMLERLIKGLFDTIIGLNPESSVFLDQKAVTAIFNFIESLPDYRNSYIDTSDLIGEAIPRKKLLNALPLILKSQFPRTFNGCNKFGFSESCTPAFEHIFNEEVPDHDLDLITLIAMAMEGVLDSCDENQDQQLSLSLNPINSNDELACTTRRFSDVIRRLTAARIISSEGQAGMQAILTFIQINGLTRVFGKIPLITGTTKYMFFTPVLLPPVVFEIVFTKREGRANLGSLYSLIGDVIEEKSETSPPPIHPPRRPGRD